LNINIPLDTEASEHLSFTQLIASAQGDELELSEQLFKLVFDQLHGIASQQMRAERSDHTLQATALVNEAYLRLFSRTERSWQNRDQFLGYASHAMRLILVDHARNRGRLKRAARGERVPLDVILEDYEQTSANLIELNAALERLGKFDARMVRMVELRFFAGRPMKDVARVLCMPLRSAEREWFTARAWLRRELSKGRAVLPETEDDILPSVMEQA
jgi:RNA polymerase sigma-70 factor (ECF subfamily)